MIQAIGVILLLLLAACDHGPTEADMAGCAIRGGGPAISTREVADCAVTQENIWQRKHCEGKHFLHKYDCEE